MEENSARVIWFVPAFIVLIGITAAIAFSALLVMIGN